MSYRPGNYAVFLSVMLLSVSSLKAEEMSPAGESAVVLPDCSQFDLKSADGTGYRIFVRKPTGKVPEGGSPVIYVTDGNANFPLLCVALQRQPAFAGAVIVGIGYSSDDVKEHHRLRTRDLLFPVDPAWIKTQPPQFMIHMGKESGGAEAFLNFIEQQLKPVIERQLSINRQQQMLFGHSFGGLFVLQTLFQHPEAFQKYCAASPSIWVNDRSILKEIPAFVSRLNALQQPVQLLVTVGEEENPGFGGPPDREEMLKARRQVDNARDLVEQLQGVSPYLTARFEIFVHEDHGTATLPAANRAIRMFGRNRQ